MSPRRCNTEEREVLEREVQGITRRIERMPIDFKDLQASDRRFENFWPGE